MVFALMCLVNNRQDSKPYTRSLHDALPIFQQLLRPVAIARLHRLRLSTQPAAAMQRDHGGKRAVAVRLVELGMQGQARSEEHTSELQPLTNIVCRLLLEKKQSPMLDLQSKT